MTLLHVSFRNNFKFKARTIFMLLQNPLKLCILNFRPIFYLKLQEQCFLAGPLALSSPQQIVLEFTYMPRNGVCSLKLKVQLGFE